MSSQANQTKIHIYMSGRHFTSKRQVSGWMQLKFLLSPVVDFGCTEKSTHTCSPRFQREGPIGRVGMSLAPGNQQLKPPVHPHVRQKRSLLLLVKSSLGCFMLLHFPCWICWNHLKLRCFSGHAHSSCGKRKRTQSLSLGIASCRTCRILSHPVAIFCGKPRLPLVAKYAIDFLQTNRGFKQVMGRWRIPNCTNTSMAFNVVPVWVLKPPNLSLKIRVTTKDNTHDIIYCMYLYRDQHSISDYLLLNQDQSSSLFL